MGAVVEGMGRLVAGRRRRRRRRNGAGRGGANFLRTHGRIKRGYQVQPALRGPGVKNFKLLKK